MKQVLGGLQYCSQRAPEIVAECTQQKIAAALDAVRIPSDRFAERRVDRLVEPRQLVEVRAVRADPSRVSTTVRRSRVARDTPRSLRLRVNPSASR